MANEASDKIELAKVADRLYSILWGIDEGEQLPDVLEELCEFNQISNVCDNMCGECILRKIIAI
jgi:hypothetical protein